MGGNSIDYTLFTISGHLLKMYEASRSLDVTKECKHYIDEDVKRLYENLHEDVTALVNNFLDSIWCLHGKENIQDVEIEYTTFRVKLKEETNFDYKVLYLQKEKIKPCFHDLYFIEGDEETEEYKIKRSIAEEYNCLLKHCFNSVGPNTKHVIQVYSNARSIYQHLDYVKQHELYRKTEKFRFYLSRVIYDCLSIMHKIDIYAKYYLLIHILQGLRKDPMVINLYEETIQQPPMRDFGSIYPEDIGEYDLFLKDIKFIDSLPFILDNSNIEELQRDLADTVKFVKYKDFKYLKAIQMVINYSDNYFKKELESNLGDIIKKYNLVWNEEYKKFCFETVNPRNIQWSDKEEVDKRAETKEERWDKIIKENKIGNLISRYHESLLR
jgi:hypothetical protein